MNGKLIANLTAFQTGWLACVLGGNLIGLAVTLVILGAHLRWLALPGEWRWLLGFAGLGLLVDGGLTLAGGFEFAAADTPGAWPLPPWLWLLWPLFASTLQHGLAWLWTRPRLAMLGGAFSAPLSYYGGAALAGVELAPWLLVAEGLIWCGLCYWLSRRLGQPRAS